MNESIASLMQAVHDAASFAGDVALRYYRTGLEVEAKHDGSPVTIADRTTERALREWIQERFPADAIQGEEFDDLPGTSGRTWIVDPIDGTKSFIRGVPLWGSLVAIAEGHRVLAGAAAFPASGEIIAAAVGCGAWYNGHRAQVSEVTDISRATVLISDDRKLGPPLSVDGWEVLTRRAAVARTWGDCFGYLLVATGRAEVMVDMVMNPWDAACFLPIIEEAGGKFSDLTGAVTAFGGHSIATNALLASVVRQCLTIRP
jgi:histidinol phosphatase-like enzyme (inositol monophosphatase family)